MGKQKHILSFSGGIGSYFVLKRILNKISKEDLLVIFLDVGWEDEDLYRFLEDTEKKFGIEILRLSNGLNPKELSEQQNFLYNSRVANCSKILKSKLFRDYIRTLPNQDLILYFGIDFTENHRCKAIEKNYSKYKVEFPLCEPPYLYKHEMLEMLKKDDIKIPRLYKMGFSHNNCGGRCFKAGIAHYKLLFEHFPDRYKEMEEFEIKMQNQIGKNVTILKRSKKPFSLTELRIVLENESNQLTLGDLQDFGGCGCFVELEKESKNCKLEEINYSHSTQV